LIIVIVPSISVPIPFKLVEFVGSVIVISAPALAVGTLFGAGFTVTCIVSFPVAPLLSITVNSN